MENIIRIKNIDVKNIKNVKHGSIKTNTDFNNINSSDIIGFYGQNGSGKTAMVEAFALLKSLLDSKELPDKTEYLLKSDQESIELFFDFLIKNKFGEYMVRYESKLELDKERLTAVVEKLSYKENIANKRFKDIIFKDHNKIEIRKKSIRKISEEYRLKVMLSNEMAIANHTGFIFRDELEQVFQNELNKEELEIIKNLAFDFNKDFHIIDNIQNGLILANILLPFSIHLNNIRGKIPYELKESMLLSQKAFETIDNVVIQINAVINSLIPGLQVIVKPIHKETMDSGEEGIRFEFLSEKNGVRLPLRCESAGILKLISILSTLIAVYNNPNACVVIDELDSGVFEYLLGEILEVLDLNGKGQLFFTSHNLRILEVLDNKNLWFTTMNEDNRFIQLKGIKKLSNARDVYLRAVQLGGQDEELYKETDSYDIKKAFRKAGGLNV